MKPDTKRKGVFTRDTHDYYAMLDLADRRWRATPQEIKDAYKRVSLRCVLRRCAEPCAWRLIRS